MNKTNAEKKLGFIKIAHSSKKQFGANFLAFFYKIIGHAVNSTCLPYNIVSIA